MLLQWGIAHIENLFSSSISLYWYLKSSCLQKIRCTHYNLVWDTITVWCTRSHTTLLNLYPQPGSVQRHLLVQPGTAHSALRVQGSPASQGLHQSSLSTPGRPTWYREAPSNYKEVKYFPLVSKYSDGFPTPNPVHKKMYLKNKDIRQQKCVFTIS